MRMAVWLKQKLSAWGGVALLGIAMTAVSGLPARADLEFCNHTAEKQWVVIGYKSEGKWMSEGWWGVEVDECTTPLAGDLENRHYYYRLFDTDFVGEGFSFCLKKEVFVSEDADDCDTDGFAPADFADIDTLPGVTCANPGGAFYVFPNISGTGLTAKQAQDKFLEEAGVATIAGTSFGAWGEGFVRFSYANSLENIEEAIKRIAAVL